MTELKKIRLIALDLDDTTLCSDSRLAPETEKALKRAVSAGIEVVVASGRAFKALPAQVLGIGGISYAITTNGAAIERVPDGERIMNFSLRPASVMQILELFGDERLEAFVDGQPYCDAEYAADPLRYGCAPAYVEYVRTTRRPVADMRAFILQNIERLDSIDVLSEPGAHHDALRKKAGTLENVYVTSSSPRLVEISDAAAGKGAALKRLCAMLGVPAEHTAAFGNGDNDADMLRFAGLGVAVKNASKSCLEAADIVCASNDELGVAQMINRIVDEVSAAAPLSFRKAAEDDVAAVAGIYESIHTAERAGRLSTGWIAGVYPVESTARAALERGELFVCKAGETVAAAIINKRQVDVYALGEWLYPAEDDEVMVLHTLVVEPEASGRGVGKAFVGFYEDYARENGCKVLRMDTNARNLRARAMYAKLGYREAGTVPCAFNGIPDVQLVLLEKKL
ncbi:MAG: GNAT family N-acetyltransferase [Oscillospiraceae bacterium]|nr:GNAT family N-acetyltransferase [Oscillospiraceae bacterium]